MLNSRYLKRNFSSRPNHKKNNQNAVALNALALPNELLRIVFSYVKAKRDLAALCCTSRMFRLEAERLMYSSVEFPMQSYSIGRKFLRCLKHERISSLVTELTVSLPDPFCLPDSRKSTIFTIPFLKTPCRFLGMFEQTLSELGNLTFLSIVCTDCKHNTHSHDYFRGLKTTSLRTLKFFCSFLLIDTEDVLLSTPSIRNVEVLELHIWLTPPCRALLSVLFPNLRHLINGLDSLCYTTLTQYQPIQLTCSEWSLDFHQALEQHPQSLRILRVLSEHPALYQLIWSNPHPYRYIKHFGEIQIWNKDSFAETLDVLALLPSLVSFDMVSFLRRDGRNLLWNPQLLGEIHLTLPRLTKIFLDERMPFHPPFNCSIWEFKKNEWQREASSQFSGWDLLDEKRLIE